ncbi:MAG: T9SS type A sorting domain-containing protein [Melioribacteraceae bacterium]|nr:T9SS type A sorting domain-containing protein [Melioribacteraceae bacterium]
MKYSIPVEDAYYASLTNVSLIIYDVLGREVTTLVNNKQFPGTYEVEFNAASVNRRIPSGVYYYQLRAGAYQQTKKMLLLR